MSCGCGKPKCDGHCGISPAVLQINNPSECTLFHRVEVSASMGDSKTNPPKNGAYKNVLLYYEADQTSWFYSSDGIPTKLVSGVQDYEAAVNLPQINGETLIGNKTGDELGLQDKLTAGDNISIEGNTISAVDTTYGPATDSQIGLVKPGDGLSVSSDGTLAVIDHVFDTVADMKASTELENGDYAQTLGFHSLNDGGGAIYKITSTGTANEMDVIAVGDLYANVCLSIKAIPEQFGAYGDGVHDDLIYLNRCESYCIEHGLIMAGNPSSIYGIGDGFTIETGVNIDFNTATIKALTTMDYVVRQHRITQVHTDPVLNEYTKNIVIDCDNKAEYGFYQDILGWSVLTDNIRVLNPKQIGIYIKVGQIRLMNSKVEQMDRTKSCIGLQVDSNDSEYTNIVTRECTTGIKINANGNTFSECHPVIFYNPIEGSVGFDLNNRTELVNCMSDTFHYGIKISHNTGFRAINFRAIGEASYYNAQSVSTVPYFLYSTNTDVSCTYYITLVGCDMARSAIFNSNEYMKFSNFDTWAGGSLRLANPNFMLTQFANEVTKETRQANSGYNIKTLIAENFTVDNAQILRNGNTFAIRLENITLPAITAETTTTIFSNIDTTHRVGTTIQEDVTTENGVPCRLTIRSDGTIRILPKANITAGDHLYKYIYILV